ncbi:hypothetical protein F4820DRAFT_414232, partial [Hypoxylon rubiginosum]
MAPQKFKAAASKAAAKAKAKAKKQQAPVPAPSNRHTWNLLKESPSIKAARLAAERDAEKEVAREKQVRKRREQAAKVESPTCAIDNRLVLSATLTTSQKRPANAAFDDRGQNKRLKLTGNDGDDEGPPAFPWEKNKKLEQPPSLPVFGVGFESTSLNPIKAMGDLGKLPTEIRDKIFRYLLISDRNIMVFNDWSIVYPRMKPKLDVAILRTCKVLHMQGIRILFGENTFLYNIRDVVKGDLSPGSMSVLYGGCVVPIDKYGHLIRHITIHISPNRLFTANVSNFANAIQKFLPDRGLVEPANIHTLTFEIPVKVGQHSKRPQGSICVWDLFGSDVRDALSKLNIQFIRVIGTVKMNLMDHRFHYEIDLRYIHKQKQEQNDETKTQHHECPAMKKRIQSMVDTATARLYNIPVRIWELATLGPEKANVKKLYWTLSSRADGGAVAAHPPCLDTSWIPRDRLSDLTPKLPKDARMATWLDGVSVGSNPWR